MAHPRLFRFRMITKERGMPPFPNFVSDNVPKDAPALVCILPENVSEIHFLSTACVDSSKQLE